MTHQDHDSNYLDVDVSENSGTPKSSVLIGFSIINHPFWGTPIFGNTHVIGFQSSSPHMHSSDYLVQNCPKGP